MHFDFRVWVTALLSFVRGFFIGTHTPTAIAPFVPPRGKFGRNRIRIGGRRRYYPNGDHEVARRKRQIAEGRLTASNGVVFDAAL